MRLRISFLDLAMCVWVLFWADAVFLQAVLRIHAVVKFVKLDGGFNYEVDAELDILVKHPHLHL